MARVRMDGPACVMCGGLCGAAGLSWVPHPRAELAARGTVACSPCVAYWRRVVWTTDRNGVSDQCVVCGLGGAVVCCENEHESGANCHECVYRLTGKPPPGDDAPYTCFICDTKQLTQHGWRALKPDRDGGAARPVPEAVLRRARVLHAEFYQHMCLDSRVSARTNHERAGRLWDDLSVDECLRAVERVPWLERARVDIDVANGMRVASELTLRAQRLVPLADLEPELVQAYVAEPSSDSGPESRVLEKYKKYAQATKRGGVEFDSPKRKLLKEHVDEGAVRRAVNGKCDSRVSVGQLAEGHPVLEIDGSLSYGLFATEHIPECTVLGVYAGEVQLSKQSSGGAVDPREYVMELPKRKVPSSLQKSYGAAGTQLIVDANLKRNEVSFTNAAGSVFPKATVVSTPNAEYVPVFVDGRPHMILVSIAPIVASCEVLVDYGPKYWVGRLSSKLGERDACVAASNIWLSSCPVNHFAAEDNRSSDGSEANSGEEVVTPMSTPRATSGAETTTPLPVPQVGSKRDRNGSPADPEKKPRCLEPSLRRSSVRPRSCALWANPAHPQGSYCMRAVLEDGRVIIGSVCVDGAGPSTPPTDASRLVSLEPIPGDDGGGYRISVRVHSARLHGHGTLVPVAAEAKLPPLYSVPL